MHQEIIDKIKPELEKTVNYLERELSKIRTSRANPSLVEDVVVDCFGQKFPLKQLAAISVPQAKQILIQPWDKSYIEGIVSALEKTGVGASPVVDKDVIRINLPPLNEEYRRIPQEFIKDNLGKAGGKQKNGQKVASSRMGGNSDGGQRRKSQGR